jgi:hypothetical protein
LNTLLLPEVVVVAVVVAVVAVLVAIEPHLVLLLVVGQQ